MISKNNKEIIIESQWFAFDKSEIKNFIILNILDVDYWLMYVVFIIIAFLISLFENNDFLAFKIGLSCCFFGLLVEIISIIFILLKTTLKEK